MMVTRFAREMLLHEMLLREGLLASLVKYYFVNIHCSNGFQPGGLTIQQS